LNESRYFDYQFRNLNNRVNFEAYQDIGFLVNCFITVEVHYDDGAQYGGMGSGRGYIFFLRAGFNLVDAIEEFNAVAIALNEDLKSISS